MLSSRAVSNAAREVSLGWINRRVTDVAAPTSLRLALRDPQSGEPMSTTAMLNAMEEFLTERAAEVGPGVPEVCRHVRQ